MCKLTYMYMCVHGVVVSCVHVKGKDFVQGKQVGSYAMSED